MDDLSVYSVINNSSASGLTIGYTYNGLGDRLSQFTNGVTTHYTLDLNAGLTQVLQDGANTYLYGVNPLRGPCSIAQVAETQTGYFLPDASLNPFLTTIFLP